MTESAPGFKPDTGVSARDESAIEDEARKQGWVDKDTYVERGGNPDTWRPAEKFLAVGEEIDVKRQNKALKSEIDQLKQVTAAFQPFMQKAIAKAERERDEAIAKLKDQRDAAVESGDKKAYREATDALEVAEKEQRQGNQSQPKYSPVTQAWLDRNGDWWSANTEARAFADGLAPQIQAEMPGLNEAQFLSELETRVLRRFPRHQAPRRESEVDSGGRGDPPRTSKSFKDLPPEVQKECDRFVAEIPNFTREQFVKSYEWED